jgi:hypothetical protein
MKKNIFHLIAILLLTVFSTGSFAQDNRTLETKVADILAQMPTKDLVHRDRVLTELIGLGQDGFQKVTNLLLAPGTGDDTAVRFALNSCARFASEFGKEADRDFVESQLLKALGNQPDKDVKTFLLNQLNLVGSEKTIAVVKAYLTDEYLVEPATQTLLSIGGKPAAHAILEVFPTSSEKCKPTLIKALGELQCTGAVQQITLFVNDKNTAIKKVTLAALLIKPFQLLLKMQTMHLSQQMRPKLF